MNTESHHPFLIGILSDTHGEVPPAALKALSGVRHIIHAGDVVGAGVIPTLEKIAPLTAIKGNMDGSRNPALPHKTQYITLNKVGIYVLHDLYQLDIDPKSAGVQMVVHGHTHRPEIDWQQGILFINPGSVSQPRGGHPPSIAVVQIESERITPRIISI